MTRLLLIRHGSTAWNAEGRYQGQTNTSLSARGHEQALRLAERLRSEDIDALCASDLARAWETAELIAAQHHLPIRPEPRLREINFGEWEGQTHAEIEQHNSATLAEWFDDPMHRSPPGGETLQEVVDRVKAAFDTIVDQHPEGTVAVVAHGGTLRALICGALEMRPDAYWQFQIDLASISELALHPEGAILRSLNDTAHLQPPQGSHRSGGSDPTAEVTAMADPILVLGGARSGKSDFAQRIVEEVGDPEMERRIAAHQQARPDQWHTLEARRNVGNAILDCATDHSFQAVLVDCATLLTSNLLSDADDPFAEEVEAALMGEIEDLIACARQLAVPVVVVSNVVGWGLVPPYPSGRAYRDLLGRANQALAAGADEVVLLVAGIPNVLKATS